MKVSLRPNRVIDALETIERMLPAESFICLIEAQALRLITKKRKIGIRYLTAMAASLLILISFNLSFLKQDNYKSQTALDELKLISTNDIYLLPAKSIYHE